jgi:hypothetical protein
MRARGARNSGWLAKRVDEQRDQERQGTTTYERRSPIHMLAWVMRFPCMLCPAGRETEPRASGAGRGHGRPGGGPGRRR